MGCRNEACGERNSIEWKQGWPLRSGTGFAILCYSCGTAYDNSLFCETFHSEETGWRDCASCGKKLHCGCIVSKSLYELLDYGGVGCINCANRSRVFSNNTEVPKGLSRSIDVGGSPSTPVPNRVVVGDSIDEGRLLQLCKIMEANEPNLGPRFQRQEIMPKIGELVPDFPTVTPSSLGSLPPFHAPDSHESLVEPSLKMTLGAPSRTSNLVLALSGVVGDVRDQSNTPSLSFEQQRNRPILPKPMKSILGTSAELSKGVLSPMRIARPPGEGRGKNQLLPRYWPRITEQELEKLSGDLNSTIVPLFEKVLSASDAGRIGRLVLPKACAESYFPPISQSEGLPLRIQDVKGNEWTFQFRFWPNNNSRMYVLEGVTPCIQAMQLQAGDTVTFSRIDPGGKLVMGFRKSSNNGETPEGEMSTSPNGTLGEPSYSSPAENLPAGNGYPSLTQNALYSENLLLTNGDIGPQHKIEKNGFRKSEDLSQQPASTSEKKKTKNIGSKSKRLLMHSEDVLELRLTWEEAQELLRPPPTVNPSVVTVEDHEFEEYDEPPVFGKRTLFVSSSPRGHEQWAQCDDCSKWRKLPTDVLLPPKWTCSDNEWDSARVSCSVPEEMSLKELENLLRATKVTKKRRISENRKPAGKRVPSGLDALARAAVLGDNLGQSGEPYGGATATTTRHPRHRPGCTCIVCIQPPSGKGKHKPTCTCTVCMTVKRRFKTLMLRKKKRQFERDVVDSSEPKKEDEPEMISAADVPEMISAADVPMPTVQAADHMVEIGAGQIDLNCHPSREDMQMEVEMQELNTVNLLGEPISKLNGYPNQQQPGLGPCLHRTANGDGAEELFASPAVWESSDSKSNGVFIDPNLD